MLPPPRPARASVVALLAAVLAGLVPGVVPGVVPVGVAHADGSARTVSGGRLDWGVKSSFQSYVTGPIAQGRWDLQGGAATTGGSRFRFHSAKGSYDAGSGAFEAGFSGGVHFTGHKKPDGSYELDLTLSRPTVRIAGASGTLYADTVSKAKGTGEVTRASQVPVAALDLKGVNMRGAGTAVSLANVPATLTADGAKAFAGYYTAGTALDPVALSADVLAAAGPPSPGPSAPEQPEKKDTPKGEFTGAAVDWGVRRTFREYVTGSIAQGSWKLADGAQDGGALFRFPAGRGTYDEAARTLDAAFTGTVRFTGNHLDLALSAVKVTAADGKGTLSADVTSGGTQPRRSVPLVTFDASDLKEKDGLAAVTEAPAELTAEGAEAFAGMYRKGEAMDPVSLAVPLSSEAKLPPLPDLGKASAPAEGDPTAGQKADSGRKVATKSATDTSSDSSFPVLPVVAGAVGVVVVAAAVVVALRRRRAAAG
ncbi:HtaA domain-containing protein [Streptomyces roseoverticillatus]|uniref:HtaA domain-containing protein n=1 Tax=Streptomyces roseoverticillatus TaxID=66429 RepID=UPI001F37E908|nr:HtaA domain-containing protein [Streptomyces roseoverticillatus]MCF3104419.1 HtaA domain-containing protein [Streptomyces roseoverticillatus]